MRLTKKGFMAWLRSKNPQTIVGRRTSANCCPLARYMSQLYGVPVRVYPDWHFVAGGGGRQAPMWARAFVHSVDGVGVRRITAGRALVALLGEKP